MTNKISAVIFDLNGVLMQSEYLSRMLERDYSVPNDEVIEALNEIMPRLREPNAPSTWSLIGPYVKEWKIPLSKDEFLDYWFKGEGLNQDLFDYVKELKENGKKVFILSNNFKERFDYYAEHISPLLDLVDKAYFSFQTGFVKPNPKAWQNVLDEFDLDPSKCLYVDDSNTNIIAAKSLGIIAVKYSGIEDLKQILS